MAFDHKTVNIIILLLKKNNMQDMFAPARTPFDLSSLPLEVLVNIALQMDIPDVLAFCRLSKRIDRKVCRRRYFWKLLLKKDNLDIPPELIYKGGKFNWLLYFLLKYPEKRWGWYGISSNPNITWEIIQKYSNLPWNWNGLSINPNTTWEIIQKYPDKKWGWYDLSMNPNITPEIIQKYSDKDWDWEDLSSNPNITWEFIQSHPNEKWNWYFLSSNPNITWEIIQANPNLPWSWEGFSENPSITWEIVQANSRQTLELVWFIKKS